MHTPREALYQALLFYVPPQSPRLVAGFGFQIFSSPVSPSVAPNMGPRLASSSGHRIPHSGGRRPLLREGGPISFEARHSACFQLVPPPPHHQTWLSGESRSRMIPPPENTTPLPKDGGALRDARKSLDKVKTSAKTSTPTRHPQPWYLFPSRSQLGNTPFEAALAQPPARNPPPPRTQVPPQVPPPWGATSLGPELSVVVIIWEADKV